MRWTEHAEKEHSATVFNIHALLALPKASFIWSIICLSIFFTLRLWSLTIGGTLMCLNTEPSARSLADATQLPECRTVPFISTAAVVIIILHAAFVTRKFLAVGKITCNEAYN
ncbi:hypothetical protein EW026_g1336 [Hermanssonia centrifuga]|uniref:Uncharacterized protein n=1 Tax=Hermanssonia centrifuga TaxID=98765 RepID=A0A4S4KRQ6_9APHY|nr:hypothetical protein EW026_g1336 [Hermanssonia centrifuga]